MALKRSADDMEEPRGQLSSSSTDKPLTLQDIEPIIKREVKKALVAMMEEARKTTRIEVLFNPRCEDPELEEISHKLEGEDGKRIIQELGLLPITHFLKVALSEQQCCKGPFTHAFTRAMKTRKISECHEKNTKAYVKEQYQMWRIAYMREDRPLMEAVFEEMQETLASIHQRHL
jgi:hypothetical protein